MFSLAKQTLADNLCLVNELPLHCTHVSIHKPASTIPKSFVNLRIVRQFSIKYFNSIFSIASAFVIFLLQT